jgi:hypothetical protein
MLDAILRRPGRVGPNPGAIHSVIAGAFRGRKESDMVRRIALLIVVVAGVVGLELSLAGLPGPGTEARAQEPATKDDMKMMKMKMTDMLKDETRMMMAKDEMKRDPNAMDLMTMRMIVKEMVMEMKKDPQMMAMMKERMAMMKKDEMMMDDQKKMSMMRAMMRDEKTVKAMIREVLMEMMMSDMMMMMMEKTVK